jgi:acetyl/propionyl-CoA carboxylase alpha subunit
MKPEVRKRMGEQAANLARAVGYKNTGMFCVILSRYKLLLDLNSIVLGSVMS